MTDDIATDPAFDDPTFTRAPATSQTGSSFQDRADEWQKKADAKVEEALLALPKSILTVSLYPFTTARASLLRAIRNEFVIGAQLSSLDDPFLSVGRFLAIMSVPLKEARQLAVNPSRLDDEAYIILDQIKLKDMPIAIAEINSYVKSETDLQVYGELPESNDSESSPKN